MHPAWTLDREDLDLGQTGGQKFASKFLGLMKVGGRERLGLQESAVRKYICKCNEGSFFCLPGS
jgi:hypothetical protein